MLRLSCAFCAHRNPEGSSFCNRCGSPLDLAPCTRCEAINNLHDDWCHACGSPLDDAQAPAQASDVAAHEPPQVADEADAAAAAPALDAYVASTSIAEIWDPQTPHELNDEQQDDIAAYPADDPPARVRYPPGAHYGMQTTRWPQRIALGLAFAATAGGVYWSTLETAPATTTPAAEAPAPPSDAVTTIAPTAVAPPPVPPAAPAESARTEPAPDETAPAQASVRPPPPETRPRATATSRTREQAARDALATRRLIERDLGVATGAESAPTRSPR